MNKLYFQALIFENVNFEADLHILSSATFLFRKVRFNLVMLQP